MQCPDCGSPVEQEARHGHFRVCPHCRSAFVLDEKAARISGKMAALAPTAGPLYVGASGRVGRRPFRVLGRVRYGWESGYWDEWFVALDDDGETTGWISEDGDDFTLELWSREPRSTIDYDAVEPGQRVRLGRKEYHIDERGVAVCEAGEGQLPFEFEPGETVRYLDLTGEESFATIEFEEDGGIRVFHGVSIERSSIHVDIPKSSSDSMDAGQTAHSGARERIVRDSGRQLKIHCDGCGASLTVPEAGQETLTCEHCQRSLDLTLERIDCPECESTVPVHMGEEAAAVTCRKCGAQLGLSRDRVEVLGHLTSKKRPARPFDLGSSCTIDGIDYVLIGHIRYREQEGLEVYVSDEFLLWSKKVGYRWLVLEDRHFSLAAEISKRPGIGFGAKPQSSFNFDGRRWKVFESGTAEIVFVDGELPWVARVGDRVRYLDATSPPYLLSGEFTENEAEWYRAEYLDGETVARAFGRTKPLPRPSTVAPHQPYRIAPLWTQSALVMIIFCALNVLLAIWASFTDGRTAGTFRFTHPDYAGEYISEPFTIEGSDTLCKAIFYAPVNNSWVHADVAVIDEQDRAIHEFSTTVSYYHGVEDGESWSEGSQRRSIPFKLETAGDYRLVVAGSSGTGESAGRTGPELTIHIQEGIVLARWFIVVAVLGGLWAAFIYGHRVVFESRRWKNADDADDD